MGKKTLVKKTNNKKALHKTRDQYLVDAERISHNHMFVFRNALNACWCRRPAGAVPGRELPDGARRAAE